MRIFPPSNAIDHMAWNPDQLHAFIRYEHQSHNWIRLLGAFGQAYRTPAPDDGHYNLSSGVRGQIATRNVDFGMDYQMIFFPTSASLSLLINSGIQEPLGQAADTWDALLGEIESVLTKEGFDAARFRSKVEVRYPDLLDPAGLRQPDLAEQSLRIRAAAHQALQRLLDQQKQSDGEIRIWPHNFDTGISLSLPQGYSQYAGYTPADEAVCAAPYFYNSFYQGSEKNHPDAPPPLHQGHWINTEHWCGAVLPLDRIGQLDQLAEQASQFLLESTAAMAPRWTTT